MEDRKGFATHQIMELAGVAATALIIFGFAMPAFAQHAEKPVCVDATRNSSYNARPISPHDILVRNAMGDDRRSLRLGTSCMRIDRTANVSLHSLTQCIAKGDEVAMAAIDGQREVCRVTSVLPGEDYATAKYK